MLCPRTGSISRCLQASGPAPLAWEDNPQAPARAGIPSPSTGRPLHPGTAKASIRDRPERRRLLRSRINAEAFSGTRWRGHAIAQRQTPVLYRLSYRPCSLAGLKPATPGVAITFELRPAPENLISPGRVVAYARWFQDNAPAPARERTYDASGALRQYETLIFLKFAAAAGGFESGRLRGRRTGGRSNGAELYVHIVAGGGAFWKFVQPRACCCGCGFPKWGITHRLRPGSSG